ncbi:MAG: hypothetical protein AAF518_00010 [Spirochaetota bacterium]
MKNKRLVPETIIKKIVNRGLSKEVLSHALLIRLRRRYLVTTDLVRCLIRSGLDVNYSEKIPQDRIYLNLNYSNLLRTATSNNDTKLVKVLLKNGAWVNDLDEYGYTVLSFSNKKRCMMIAIYKPLEAKKCHIILDLLIEQSEQVYKK